MNNEFKKTIGKDQTVYTLESASGGGTSSGNIASVSMPMGSTRKRGDNILAQETDKKTVPVSTPRNFVAKNAKMGGAGQHKDKKKAEKQGDVKHRKPFSEQGVAEGLDDTVRFEVDSENAYNHIMDQFGSVIDWDGDTMVAPRKYWGAIQELALAASGEASEEHGVAEGAPELLKKEMPLHRHAEKLLAQNGVSKDDPDYHHHLGNTIKHLRQFGNIDLINKNDEQGVAEASTNDYFKRRKDEEDRIAGTKAPAKRTPKQTDYEKKRKEQGVAEEGYGTHPSQRVDPRTGKKYVPPKSPLGKGVAEGEKTMSRAAKGNEKYGKDGMKALAKAGREGASEKKLDAIRDKHDNYNEEWSQKYKSSINCSHPKGFSQKAHCAGKSKHNESMTMEATCPDCGMCQTHGNLNEIKKGAKDSNGYTKCWSGYHAAGTKKSSTTGKQVRNCVPNEGVSEDHEIQMASSELQSIAKNSQALLHMVRKYSEQEGLDAWQQSKITKAADYLNAVLQSISGEQNPLEGVGVPSYGVGGYRNRGDDERHDLDVPKQDPKETMMYNLTIDGKPLNPKPILGRSNLIKWGRQQAATGVDLSNAVISPVRYEESSDPYFESLTNKLDQLKKK